MKKQACKQCEALKRKLEDALEDAGYEQTVRLATEHERNELAEKYNRLLDQWNTAQEASNISEADTEDVRAVPTISTINHDNPDVTQVAAALADACHAGGLSRAYYRKADDALARLALIFSHIQEPQEVTDP